MSNFIDYLTSNIQLQMRLGYTQDHRRLTGLRNIKSDYDYIHSKNPKQSEVEILKSLYKEREENTSVYQQGSDLYLQEVIEMEILKPFIPAAPKDSEVLEYLSTLNLEKVKSNFKKFQDACENKFGQKVDSQLILTYVETQ